MKKVKEIIFRLQSGISVGWWAFKNPQAMNVSNFKMLSDLLCLILKVGSERRHMMTRIACVHPEEGEKEIVSIWAGAGIASDPLKRITELIEENNKLKLELSVMASKNQTILYEKTNPS